MTQQENSTESSIIAPAIIDWFSFLWDMATLNFTAPAQGQKQPGEMNMKYVTALSPPEVSTEVGNVTPIPGPHLWAPGACPNLTGAPCPSGSSTAQVLTWDGI